ncbi:hypothetical protein SAMN02745115_00186 [[Eubacterium] yurii]|nr:hypothetical protein SAMN02745115_00186 [[Eubacterium] yurii]
MFKQSKNQSEKAFEEIIEKRIVPMLTEYQPFNDLMKYISSEDIKTSIENIKKLIMEERKQVLEVNNLHKEKAKIAPKVLYLSGQINSGNKSAEKEMDNVKERMLEINEEIEKKEIQIQEILVNKEKENLELLKKTLNESYDIINNDEKKLYPLLDEIELMRKELEDKRILRDRLQSRINSTYSFIHGFMGGKETERFDEHMLE